MVGLSVYGGVHGGEREKKERVAKRKQLVTLYLYPNHGTSRLRYAVYKGY